MRLYFANKFFTIKGSSKVTDENGLLQFYIQGKFFTFTRKKVFANTRRSANFHYPEQILALAFPYGTHF